MTGLSHCHGVVPQRDRVSQLSHTQNMSIVFSSVSLEVMRRQAPLIMGLQILLSTSALTSAPAATLTCLHVPATQLASPQGTYHSSQTNGPQECLGLPSNASDVTGDLYIMMGGPQCTHRWKLSADAKISPR